MLQATVDFELTYTRQQEEVFFNTPPGCRFLIVTKGRRFGITRGAAHACMDWCIRERKKILWGDTIHSNIDRYFERYFLPALKKLKLPWQYKKQEKQLQLCGGYIDFRSADRPENWEGFGYDVIFLNEAGIILRNRYLYANTVLPMMLDSEKSLLIAAGVPKGKYTRDNQEHPFFTLYKTARAGVSGYHLMEFTSYDNPLLSHNEIKELEKEIQRMSPGMVEQEIYGKFVDSTSGVLWMADMLHYIDKIPALTSVVIGVDPSGSKDGDEVGIVTVGRSGDNYYVLSDRTANYTPLQWATVIKNEYDTWKANVVVVERNFGGDMVKSNILTVDNSIRIRDVFASRAKEVRADPVVSFYEQGKVFHLPGLHKLENEMLSWVPGLGKSPNRVDALVWAVTYLKDKKGNNFQMI